MTLRRIVVGSDGSRPARDAVEWADTFAGALGGEVVVVTATPPGVDATGGGAPAVAAAGGGAGGGEAAGGGAPVVEAEWDEPGAAGHAGARVVVRTGDPRRVLPEAAHDLGADVLVVGSAGVGWFPALHLGHVAHYVVHHVDRPVVVVPRRADLAGPVVVGVEESPGGAAALSFGTTVARDLELPLVAVTVHEPRALDGGRVDPPTWRAEADAWLHGLAEPAVESGVATQCLSTEGEPSRVLLDVVDRARASLLVVGSRRPGPLPEVTLGSVALRVLQHAPVPVAVVPPAG